LESTESLRCEIGRPEAVAAEGFEGFEAFAVVLLYGACGLEREASKGGAQVLFRR